MPSHPGVVPMLSYRDGVAAMDWLARAFGFTERARMLDNTGRLSHGELAAGDAVIMLATPTPAYEGPRLHRESCAAARAWSEVPYVIDGVLVMVEDIDAHHARASAAGAVMLGTIEDGFPGRRYRCEDLEG